MTDTPRTFNLESRTKDFAVESILFAQKIPKNQITLPLISQFVRAATSVGANYREAECAESRKDFEHKLGICKKEAKESQYWLEVIGHAEPSLKEAVDKLNKEAGELCRIFIASVRTSRAGPEKIN